MTCDGCLRVVLSNYRSYIILFIIVISKCFKNHTSGSQSSQLKVDTIYRYSTYKCVPIILLSASTVDTNLCSVN